MRAHAGSGLLPQLLRFRHVFGYGLLGFIEGGLSHFAHLLGLLVDLLTHGTLHFRRLRFSAASVEAVRRLLTHSVQRTVSVSREAHRPAPSYFRCNRSAPRR